MPAYTTPAASSDANLPGGMSDALRELVQRGVARSYRKGTVLIEEGDLGDTLYIILSGRLRVYSSGERGREITYGTYGPGEYLGEMSLDGGPRSASVETLSSSTCAIVSRQSLLQHIAEHPTFAFELLAKVIRRARDATLTAKQLALNDVYGRLRALLYETGVEQSDGTRLIAERPTHRALAERLGCSREMVSRLLKDLSAGGQLQITDDAMRVGRLPARW